MGLTNEQRGTKRIENVPRRAPIRPTTDDPLIHEPVFTILNTPPKSLPEKIARKFDPMALDQVFPDGNCKRLSRRGLTCMSRIDESKTVHTWLSTPTVRIGTVVMAMGSVIGRTQPLRIVKVAEMAPK